MNKKIPFFFTFLSLILFLYTAYRAEIVYQSNNFNYYLPYYIISIALLIISLVIFKLSLNNQKNILLIFISTLVSLYSIEFYITLNNFPENYIIKFNKTKELYKKKHNKEYENRSVIKYYLDSRLNNKNISKFVPPKFFLEKKSLDILPLAGISNVKTIYCNENGYYSNYFSDRYGFNNPDFEWDKNKINYVFLGDSFVHGACVNDEYSIPGIVRNKNTNFGVLNLGQGGHGPLSVYAAMREYVPILNNVENIVWIYFEGNDLLDLFNESKNFILNKYLEDDNFSQNLKENQKNVNQIILNEIDISLKNSGNFFETIDEEIINNYNKSKNLILSQFIKLYSLRNLVLKFQTNKIDLQKFKKVSKQIYDFSRKNNTKIFFVYLDSYSRYLNQNKLCTTCTYKNQILDIIKDLNIEIIDTGNFFSQEIDPINLVPSMGGHFTEDGYEKLTNYIYSRLEN